MSENSESKKNFLRRHKQHLQAKYCERAVFIKTSTTGSGENRARTLNAMLDEGMTPYSKRMVNQSLAYLRILRHFPILILGDWRRIASAEALLKGRALREEIFAVQDHLQLPTFLDDNVFAGDQSDATPALSIPPPDDDEIDEGEYM